MLTLKISKVEFKNLLYIEKSAEVLSYAELQTLGLVLYVINVLRTSKGNFLDV
jgi:hypothetical protein